MVDLKLASNTGFREIACQDFDEARSIVSDIFCPHSLTPTRKYESSAFHLRFFQFGKHSSLSYLSYGCEARVEPGHMKNVFNVQVQLTGSTLTVTEGEANSIGPGAAGVLSPERHVSMDWSSDSSMLIYSVSRSAIEQTMSSLLGGPLDRPIVFQSVMNLADPSQSKFWRSLEFLINEAEASGELFNTPLAVDHYEQALILSLIYGQTNNYTDALHSGYSPIAPSHVRRVEQYIRANAQDNIDIEKLTEVSGVSSRAMFSGFRRFRGLSPMRYVREVRLDFAHQDFIRAKPGTTVTDIAFKWRFAQLGRFSAEYRKKFGESPSETLNKSYG